MQSPLASSLLELVNCTDEAALRQLLANRLSPQVSGAQRDEMLGLLTRLHQQGGVLRLLSEEPAGDGLFLKLWADRIGRGVLLYAQPDLGTPAQIARLQWLVAIDPAAEIRLGHATPSGPPSLTGQIADECARLAEAGALSGVVLVAHRDQILYHGAFGLADRDEARPIKVTTRFHQASMGKMFTSVAVAQLMESGALSLDDSLGDLLPGFAWRDEARGVTVSQLLSHTAGFGMLWDRPGFSFGKHYETCTELVSLFADAPLRFPPGAKWAYSNEGFEVLGAIIEKLTASTFTQYVKEQILRPAQMHETGADPTDDHAVAYAGADNDPFGIEPRLRFRSLGRCSAAGGWYGTAADLVRFANALHLGRLVAQVSLDRFTAPQRPFPGPFQDWYAYGFITFDLGGRRIFGHTGGGSGSGVCNSFHTFADGSYTVVTLTNYDPPLGDRLHRAIITLLTKPLSDG